MTTTTKRIPTLDTTQTLPEAARRFADAGLPVFPLTPEGKSPHRRLAPNGFYNATTDAGTTAERWSEAPNANIGLRCGTESGLVVVDVDGPDAEDGLERLEADHRQLPATLEVVTGRADGGRHLYFAHDGPLPKVDDLENLEVKGNGSYVVMPPSIHPSGATYRFDGPSAQVAPLPEWLADAARERGAAAGSSGPRHLSRQDVLKTAERNPDAVEWKGSDAALARLDEICDDLAECPRGGGPHGGRNNHLNVAAGQAAQLEAADHLDRDYGIRRVWLAAEDAGLVTDDGPFTTAGTIASGWSYGLEHPDQDVDLEAILDAMAEADWSEDPAPDENPFLTFSEVRAMPEIDYVVDEIIPDLGMTCLFGPSGSLKSFVTLDLALAVATGRPWTGRPVKGPGQVVYIAAESARSYQPRVDAWAQYHGADLAVEADERFRMHPGVVNLMDAEAVKTFGAAVDRYIPENPALVVVDTVSRSIPGEDESSAEAMSTVVDVAEGLVDRYETTVLFVHHSGWKDGRERGSSAFPAAMDARWQIEKHDAFPTPAAELTHHKNRHGRELDESIMLHTQPVGDSLVIRQDYDDAVAEMRNAEVRETAEDYRAEHGEWPYKSALEDWMTGKATELRDKIRKAAGDPDSRVEFQEDGRGTRVVVVS